MATPTRRCGRPLNFSIDADAVDIMHALVPSTKAYGRFISELIRQEMVRRETRQEMMQQIQTAATQQENI